MSPVSPYQFSFFRILIGIYLFFYFAWLSTYKSEFLTDTTFLLHYGIPIQIILFLLALTALTICIGFHRRIFSLLLWAGWSFLYIQNIFSESVGLAFMGWLLLALALIPEGEPWSRPQKREDWELPKELYWGGWLILSLGYLASGLYKINSPYWVDGTALTHILNSPFARDTTFRDILTDLPGLLKVMTWGLLCAHLSFLPLALFKKIRPWIWSALVIIQVGTWLLLDMSSFSVSVLFMHLFLFDRRWIKPKPAKDGQSVLFFDGICGLCNNFVDFVFSEDDQHVFKVATLQGDYAQNALGTEKTLQLNTIYIIDQGITYSRSSAILIICYRIGGFWRLFSVLRVIPRPIRDGLYTLVAMNRYRLFGKQDVCRLPTPEERALFIDYTNSIK